MKQFLLALFLIAVPVAGFSAFTAYWPHAASQAPSLGDLASLKSIVSDVQAIAASGDLAKAKARVADFETAWDDAAETMRPLNPTAWGNVDEAADKALSALRSDVPEKDEVNGTLTGLLAAIDDPNSGTDGPGAGPVVVNGIAVSDANGRYLPCETMLTTLRSALSDSKLPDAEKAAASTLQAKATERCNADDDQHADELSAQAITALGK